MQIKYFSLYVLIIVILVLQLIINNTTILYIDCLTLVLVSLLLDGFFSIRFIFTVCLLADLIVYIIIGLIDILLHKSGFSWINLLTEIIVLNPLLLLVLSSFVIKTSSDIIRTE